MSVAWLVKLRAMLMSTGAETEGGAPRVHAGAREPLYRHLVLTHNNKRLLLEAFGRRPWWGPAECLEQPDLNLFWVEFSKRTHFEDLYQENPSQRSLNHFFQGTLALTSKSGMYRSIRRYQLNAGQDPFAFIPWTTVIYEKTKLGLYNSLKDRYLFYRNRCRLCQHRLSVSRRLEYFRHEPQGEYSPLSSPVTGRIHASNPSIEPEEESPTPDPSPEELEDMRIKREILDSCGRYYQSDADSLDGEGLEETDGDRDEGEGEEEGSESGPCVCHHPVLYKNIWIIKPTYGKQGRDILVLNDLTSLLEHAKPGFVIQKYIENPHLFRSRKYDIRVFGLLRSTHEGAGLDGYIYRDCYLRTSSTPFSLSSLSDAAIHLTNDAVQRTLPSFGKFEISNKITMTEYRQYFMTELGAERGASVYASVRQQIEDIMRITFDMVKRTIDPRHYPHCFQLLGYDFMVDDEYRVILLETNTNPSINYNPKEVPFKHKLFPRMVEECFQLTVDEYFPPPDGETVPRPARLFWTNAPEFQSETDDGSNRFHQIFSC